MTSGESIDARASRLNWFATVGEAVCATARRRVCGSLLPCQAAERCQSSLLRTISALYTNLLDHIILKMPDYTRHYVAGAFLAGIALTAAYNRRLTTSSERTSSQDASKQQHKLLSKLSKINDLDTLKKTLVELESSLVKGEGAGDIKEGIEGCIGNTPLIKIKSLSEYTGCDILVKAEVGLQDCNECISNDSCANSFSTAPATAQRIVLLLVLSKW